MAQRSHSTQLSGSPFIFLAHLLVIVVTTLVLVWLLNIREGLAFQSHNKSKIFNLHPLFMIIGFILFGGEAIMAYKTVAAKRTTQKTVHWVLHLIALVSAALGLYAVFKYHHEQRFPDMYTLHSWLGIITISLYALQWLVGFLSFVFPGAKMETRGSTLQWHNLVGLVIFLLGICTAQTGLTERFLFLGLFRNQEALIVNFTGLLIVLFGICVGLSVLLP